MELLVAQASDAGPCRPNNEDYVLFWSPPDPADFRARGAVALIADGLGGQEDGEIASRLAAETALEVFQNARPGLSFNGLLWQMFSRATAAVYDAGMARHGQDRRMATTLTATLLRGDQAAIGHVGDCRVYHVRRRHLKQLTSDHTVLAFHRRLGLFTTPSAETEPLRDALTRTVGREPVVNVDFHYATLAPGDTLLQCTDGVYNTVPDNELLALAHAAPAEAARDLIDLCLARGARDNITVQVLRVRAVDRP